MIVSASTGDESGWVECPELPDPKVGFWFAGSYAVGVMAAIGGDPTSTANLLLAAGFFGGGAYYLWVVHRLHRVLQWLHDWEYPISPNAAAWSHLVPVYCAYWVFAWTGEFVKSIRQRGNVTLADGWKLGLLLLLSTPASQVCLWLQMAVAFGVLTYMTNRLREELQHCPGALEADTTSSPTSTVFRTASGKRYHSSRSCPALRAAAHLQRGCSEEQAVSDWLDACRRCSEDG